MVALSCNSYCIVCWAGATRRPSMYFTHKSQVTRATLASRECEHLSNGTYLDSIHYHDHDHHHHSCKTSARRRHCKIKVPQNSHFFLISYKICKLSLTMFFLERFYIVFRQSAWRKLEQTWRWIFALSLYVKSPCPVVVE